MSTTLAELCNLKTASGATIQRTSQHLPGYDIIVLKLDILFHNAPHIYYALMAKNRDPSYKIPNDTEQFLTDTGFIIGNQTLLSQLEIVEKLNNKTLVKLECGKTVSQITYDIRVTQLALLHDNYPSVYDALMEKSRDSSYTIPQAVYSELKKRLLIVNNQIEPTMQYVALHEEKIKSNRLENPSLLQRVTRAFGF